MCRLSVISVLLHMNIVDNSKKFLHWSNWKTIQMLYHGTAATAIHMYTILIWCTWVQVHTFIYRSYRYKFQGHLIPSFISIELWPSGYDGGFVSWRLCRVSGSNPTMDEIGFVMFTCSVFLAAGLTAFKWNQTWHSAEVIERERWFKKWPRCKTFKGMRTS